MKFKDFQAPVLYFQGLEFRR